MALAEYVKAYKFREKRVPGADTSRAESYPSGVG